MTCPQCDDGDGNCAFPHYGLAPHTHGNPMVVGAGLTKILPADQWPSNFREDPDCKGCGTYTHCLACGAGEKS